MTSPTPDTSSERDHFRIGLASPINLTALQAVISAVQAIWPEGTLGVPGRGESAVLLIPKHALLSDRNIVPQEVINSVREDTRVEADDLAGQSDITIMAPGAIEMTPPPETLNLLSGYCHALLDSLSAGANAIQQTIHIPGRSEPYVLSIQPKSQAENTSPVEWKEGTGWVGRGGASDKPTNGDHLRKKALQRLASMGNVNRVLNKATKAQIAEALRAD